MLEVEKLREQLQGYPENLNPVQVAEVLNCSRRYVDKLIDDGKIPAFALDPTKERQEKRVTKADLIGYMLNNKI